MRQPPKIVRCPVCGGDGIFTRYKDPDPFSVTPVTGESCWACSGEGCFSVSRLDISKFGRKLVYVDPVKGYDYIDPTLIIEKRDSPKNQVSSRRKRREN